ncbi:MAG: recombinase RecA [SAR324 cluster bacterium]|nr:recombinase RecA [SAR324 cluster bacterium]MCZ6627129.1 recombinase RecA [SAR324 cluster bacterium]MCZ6645318.1 recombinase RecA [SAR324 cluster bacterium]MCZ6730887.1 recombinase RecA [SAR324 cluster bacterium]MCZ6844098.1 recombinase RecA [SAR324 cluster bacterium]
MMMEEEKSKAVELAIAQVERAYGKGALMRIGDGAIERIPVVSSGDIGLDIALGVGGYPKGRVTEIYGPESSGKTTLALHAVAEVQKLGGIAAFIDVEHALDLRYSKQIGIHTEELLVSQPDYGEQALEIVEILVRSGAVDIVVIDSVAALVPKSELEGEMGDPHMAQQARLMSQAMRKLTAIIAKSNTIVMFINQLRMKVGVIFGNPETTTGGNALKFYATIRLDIRKISPIKDGDLVIGSRARVKVVKNKVSPPFRQVEFDIMHSGGISREGSLLDMAANEGIVQKSGTWYSFESERIGQGRENVKKLLVENPEMTRKIEVLIRRKHGLDDGGTPVTAEPAPQPEEAPKAGKPVKLTVTTGDG